MSAAETALHINSLSTADAGTYTCVAGRLGRLRSTITLNIRSKYLHTPNCQTLTVVYACNFSQTHGFITSGFLIFKKNFHELCTEFWEVLSRKDPTGMCRQTWVAKPASWYINGLLFYAKYGM